MSKNIYYSQVVALLLSMSIELQAKPMGYDYPTPSIPFIEGTVSTTSRPTPPPPSPAVYDDYDPEDIPADQAAAPSSQNKGYEYPVPENPLVLPTKPPKTTTTTTTSAPLPECIPVEERDLGMNLDLLEAGVPLCADYDEYNPNDVPSDQAPPAPECVPVEEQNDGYNPTFIEQGVPLCPEEELPGYEYPVPENPLILPTKVPETVVTTTSSPITSQSPTLNIFEDYDAYDVPEDQAPPAPDCVPAEEATDGFNPIFLDQGVPLCPEEELPGYENPLPLPTNPSTTEISLPECIPVEERDLGMNLDLLEAGVPLCADYDEYNPNDVPSDQAPPAPECVPVEEQNDGYNPTFIEQGVPLCPEEELPGYEYPVPENPLTLPPRVPKPTTQPPPPSTTPLSLPDCVNEYEKDLGMNPEFLDLGVPFCPAEIDDYDPSDVPADQAPPPPECVAAADQDDGYNPIFIEAGVPLCPEETEGYEYPTPANPLTLPPRTPAPTAAPLPDCVPASEQSLGSNPEFVAQGVPICPSSDLPGYQPITEPPAEPSYDDYDASDVPADQAAPRPDCVPVQDQNKGPNPGFLEQGVPLCPEEEEEGYSYPVPENPLELPQRSRKSKGLSQKMDPVMGISISREGRVFSVHLPSGKLYVQKRFSS